RPFGHGAGDPGHLPMQGPQVGATIGAHEGEAPDSQWRRHRWYRPRMRLRVDQPAIGVLVPVALAHGNALQVVTRWRHSAPGRACTIASIVALPLSGNRISYWIYWQERLSSLLAIAPRLRRN